MTETAATPRVSILMVARNTGPFIDEAILTARRQTLTDIEIVVIDDGSTDDTRAIADRHAAQDSRVRVLDGPRTGLADIRNVSLAEARGRWAAIQDSDDLLHPRHLEQLVGDAERTGATVTTANMIAFQVDPRGMRHARLFADAEGWRAPRTLGLGDYVRANSASGDAVSAGYLKPLFDMTFLRDHAITYDRRLRIAEDYDLVARILAAGGSFRFLPRPTYFYRQHAASTSNRLAASDLRGMIAAADAPLAGVAVTPDVRAAIARRTRSLVAALAHADAIDAIKARRPIRAIAALGRKRGAWQLMGRTMVEASAKRLPKPTSARADQPETLLIGDGIVAEPHVRRAPPMCGGEALIVDGLPPISRIVIGEGASGDDAAFVLSPRATVVRLD